MKKDELIDAILKHPAKTTHSKTALNQMNKGQLEEVLREMDLRVQPPAKTESDGSDLLGGETSEGASSAPSEEPVAGPASEAGTSAPVQADPSGAAPGKSPEDDAPSEHKPVKYEVSGRHPVTGKKVMPIVD